MLGKEQIFFCCMCWSGFIDRLKVWSISAHACHKLALALLKQTLLQSFKFPHPFRGHSASHLIFLLLSIPAVRGFNKLYTWICPRKKWVWSCPFIFRLWQFSSGKSFYISWYILFYSYSSHCQLCSSQLLFWKVFIHGFETQLDAQLSWNIQTCVLLHEITALAHGLQLLQTLT